jgi:catechol 2,3-dioxygenase-like lactoylglutathione lyase family enzyme
MAAIIGINHLLLTMPVGGEPLARKFYTEILGIREVPKPPALAVHGGAWFEFGGCQLHLGVDPDFLPAKKGHPALMVDDLAYFLARLQEHDCKIDQTDPIPGYQRAFTFDPFGNRIELMQAL